MTFEYLQSWRFNNVSVQPIALFGHPQNEKVFPNVQSEFLTFQLVTVASPSPLFSSRLCFCLLCAFPLGS